MKAALTCQICKSIFEKPIKISWPCQKNICKRHLFDSEGQKITHFDCDLCNTNHEIPCGDLFYPNFNLQNQINTYKYLSSEELELKSNIETLIRELEETYVKYDQADESVNDYFKQMHYEINLQRFKLKSQIDDLTEKFLDLVEEIKLNYQSQLGKTNSSVLKKTESDWFRKNLALSLRESEIVVGKLEKLRDEIKNRQLDLSSNLTRIEQDMKTYEFKANEHFNFDEFDILGKFVKQNDLVDELNLNFKVISCHSDGSIRVKDIEKNIEAKSEQKHTNAVSCLQISLNNKHLISADLDGCMNIWNIETGQLLKSIKPSLPTAWSSILCLQTTFNKNEILGGCTDSFIRLWNLDSTECVQTFQGHSKAVTCLQLLSSDYFVSGSEDLAIMIWSLITKKCSQILVGHVNSVTCLKALNDSEFASGSRDESIRIWSKDKYSDKFSCVRVLFGYSSCINGLELTSSNILISCSNIIQLWDLNKYCQCIKNLDSPNRSSIKHIQILPNNSLLSVNSKNLMELWCLKSGKCLRILNDASSDLNGLKVYYIK